MEPEHPTPETVTTPAPESGARAAGNSVLKTGVIFIACTALLSTGTIFAIDMLLGGNAEPDTQLSAPQPSPESRPEAAATPNSPSGNEPERVVITAAPPEMAAPAAEVEESPVLPPEETPSVQDSPPPAPAADFARDTMDGLLITCSYADATMAQQTDEDYDYRPYETIVAKEDGTFDSEVGSRPLTSSLKSYNGRMADGRAARLVKYEKISPTEAELRVIPLMVHDEEAVEKINDVLSRLNQLTVAQIKQLLANYLLDEDETMTITMTSPSEGRATSLIDSGCVKVKFRDIAIRVEEGGTPDAVVAESPDGGDEDGDTTRGSVFDLNFESDVDDFIATLTDMRTNDSNTTLFRKRLLTLLPIIRENREVDHTLPETKGNTALHYACGLGYYELVDWLLNQGADVHKRTDRGASPLDCINNDPQGRIRQRLEQEASSSAPAPSPAPDSGFQQAPGALPGVSVQDTEIFNQAEQARQGHRFLEASSLYLQISQQTRNQRMKELTFKMHSNMLVQYGNQCRERGKSAEAETYLLKAASLGEIGAYAVLGGMYYLGQGVVPNQAKGIQYYRTGARLGEQNCQNCLRSLRLGW